VDYVGIDLGKAQSQVCTIDSETGEVGHQRIRTTRQRLTTVFGSRPRCRIVVEACAGSEWVARHLEGLGHEVIVADPNYAPTYAERCRRVKTDRRDAEALAQACMQGTFRRAHRLSDEQRRRRARLAVRAALVKSRSEYLRRVGAELWHHGLKLPCRRIATLRQCVERLQPPADIVEILEPLLQQVEMLHQQVAALDAELKAEVSEHEVLRRLNSAPWVGTIISQAFLATVDDPSRFESASALSAYLGLVPREWSSSEIQRRGSITKAGDRKLRSYLVQAAWSILSRPATDQTRALQRWAQGIAARRGKQRAVVALSRKVGRILYAMWRDGRDFEPALLRMQPVETD